MIDPWTAETLNQCGYHPTLTWASLRFLDESLVREGTGGPGQDLTDASEVIPKAVRDGMIRHGMGAFERALKKVEENENGDVLVSILWDLIEDARSWKEWAEDPRTIEHGATLEDLGLVTSIGAPARHFGIPWPMVREFVAHRLPQRGGGFQLVPDPESPDEKGLVRFVRPGRAGVEIAFSGLRWRVIQLLQAENGGSVDPAGLAAAMEAAGFEASPGSVRQLVFRIRGRIDKMGHGRPLITPHKAGGYHIPPDCLVDSDGREPGVKAPGPLSHHEPSE